MSGFIESGRSVEELAEAYGVDSHLVEPLMEYATGHHEMGGFLTACVQDRFVDAVNRAHPTAVHQLPGNCQADFQRTPIELLGFRLRRSPDGWPRDRRGVAVETEKGESGQAQPPLGAAAHVQGPCVPPHGGARAGRSRTGSSARNAAMIFFAWLLRIHGEADGSTRDGTSSRSVLTSSHSLHDEQAQQSGPRAMVEARDVGLHLDTLAYQLNRQIDAADVNAPDPIGGER